MQTENTKQQKMFVEALNIRNIIMLSGHYSLAVVQTDDHELL